MKNLRPISFVACLVLAVIYGSPANSLAQLIPTSVFQAVDAQRIDSDEGGLPAGLLESGDRFGRSVISIGDLDLDGVPEVVVGARSDDDGGVDAGAVYILFMNQDLTVRSASKISSTSGGLGPGVLAAGDFFGYSLASPGDLNNDGIQDLTVGAPNNDDENSNSGAVYNLFLDRTGTVNGFQKISNSAGRLTPADQGAPLGADDIFGQAAGAIGDFNNDGFVDIAVGAPGDDDGATNQGALWLLSLEEGGRVAARTKISDFDLPAGTLSPGDGFGGRHVANIGDLDGDGRDELAVGAFQDDDGGINQGALYTLFFNDDLTVRKSQKISSLEGGLLSSLADQDLFGMTVAPLGDIDGDGIPDIAVGNNRDDDGGVDRGALFIFLLNSNGTIKSEAKISSTDDFGFDSLDLLDSERFGRALGFVGDLSGDGSQVLAVGAGAGVDGGAIWLLKFNTVLNDMFLRGDVNQDGVVSFGDISSFIVLLGAGNFQNEADVDRNGVVSFSDIGPFIMLLGGR